MRLATTCVSLLVWAGLAQAAPLPLNPGPTLSIPQCSPEAQECWEIAPDVEQPNTSAKIAYHDGALFVQVNRLADDTSIELTIRKPSDRLGNTISASSRITNIGQHRIEVDPPLKRGQHRKMSLALLQEDPQTGGIRRVDLNPVGPPISLSDMTLFLGSVPPTEPSLSVDNDGGILTIHADGADSVGLYRLDPPARIGAEGALYHPTQESGASPLVVIDPLERGRYGVWAEWANHDGPSHRVEHVVWRPGTPAPDVGTSPFLMRPKVWTPDEASLSSLQINGICYADAAWRETANFIADEWKRLLGPRLEVELCRNRANRISIGPLDRRTQKRLRTHENAPRIHDAFKLDIRADRIIILGTSKLSASYAAASAIDSIATTGEVPTGIALDWADVPTRTLLHRIDGSPHAPFSVETSLKAYRHLITRGRFNRIILIIRGALQYRSHPELADPNALTREELQALVVGLKDLGAEVLPGINTPAHADWLLESHPEIREDDHPSMVCTRHPTTRVIVHDVIEELIDLFDHPNAMLLGHDEIRWRTRTNVPATHCARCAGADKAELLADWLNFQGHLLHKNGSKPIIFSDTLIPSFNGAHHDIHRAADLLSNETRDAIEVIHWMPTPGGIQYLTAKSLAVHSIPTGLLSHRRNDWADHADSLQGLGIGLWTPRPWQLIDAAPPHRSLHYSLNKTIVAGLTGWQLSWAKADLDRLLVDVAGHPSMHPNRRAAPAMATPIRLPNTGSEPLTSTTRLYRASQAQTPDRTGFAEVIASAEYPVILEPNAALHAVQWLGAIEYSQEALLRLHAQARRTKDGTSPVVGLVEFTFTDGTTEAHPVRLGRHGWHPELQPGAISQWSTQDTMLLFSPESRDTPTQIRWTARIAPLRTDGTVARVTIRPTEDGIQFRVAEPTMYTSVQKEP